MYSLMRPLMASLRTFRRVTSTHVPYVITVQSNAGVATNTAKQTPHQARLLILSPDSLTPDVSCLLGAAAMTGGGLPVGGGNWLMAIGAYS